MLPLKERFPELQLVPEVGAFLKVAAKEAPNEGGEKGSRKRGRDEAEEGSWALDDATLLSAEFHVSLSRAVLITYGQIEPLVSELRERLRAAFPPKNDSGAERSLSFGGGWTVFANDDRSKSFVSLSLGDAASHRQVLRGIRCSLADVPPSINYKTLTK
jgi:hypothetical protein